VLKDKRKTEEKQAKAEEMAWFYQSREKGVVSIENASEI
jgi:hypothetical protein